MQNIAFMGHQFMKTALSWGICQKISSNSDALNWGECVKLTSVEFHNHTKNTYIYRSSMVHFILWLTINKPRFECNKHAAKKFFKFCKYLKQC